MADVSKFPEAVRAAVASGDLVAKDDTLKIPADKSPNGQELVRQITIFEVQNYNGALALSEGKDSEVWATFSQTVNTRIRSAQRASMVADAQGPEAKIRKAAKALFEGGQFPSMEAALTAVRAMLSAQ